MSIGLFCFAYTGLIDKRVPLQYGSFAHKAAHPVSRYLLVFYNHGNHRNITGNYKNYQQGVLIKVTEVQSIQSYHLAK